MNSRNTAIFAVLAAAFFCYVQLRDYKIYADNTVPAFLGLFPGIHCLCDDRYHIPAKNQLS